MEKGTSLKTCALSVVKAEVELLTVVKFPLTDSCAPVERSVLFKVFSRVPHGAVIHRVNTQTAVVTPAV